MTRILSVGAVGLTLVSGFYVVLLAADIPDAIRRWQYGIDFGNINQWLEIPGVLFMIFLLVALNAAVWSRLSRRRVALRNFGNSGPNPFTPRSKYAV